MTSSLVDGNVNSVARFDNENLTGEKTRTLEVVDGEGRKEVVLEALVGLCSCYFSISSSSGRCICFFTDRSLLMTGWSNRNY